MRVATQQASSVIAVALRLTTANRELSAFSLAAWKEEREREREKKKISKQAREQKIESERAEGSPSREFRGSTCITRKASNQGGRRRHGQAHHR